MSASLERLSRRDVAVGCGAVFLLISALLGPTSADATKRPADADEGGALYALHCQACHGAYGRGDGPVAADLVGGVPDLGKRFARADVEGAMPIVLSGRGAMPAFAEVIDGYQARRVLRHLATLAQKEPPAPAPPSDGTAPAVAPPPAPVPPPLPAPAPAPPSDGTAPASAPPPFPASAPAPPSDGTAPAPETP